MLEYNNSSSLESDNIFRTEARRLLMACGVEMSSVENNYPVENMNNRTRRAKKQKGDENKNFQENMESDESRNWEDHNDNGGNSPYNKRSRNGKYKNNSHRSNQNNIKRRNNNSKNEDKNDSENDDDDDESDEDYDSSDKKFNREYGNNNRKNNYNGENNKDVDNGNNNNDRRNNRNNSNRNYFLGEGWKYNYNNDADNKKDYNSYGAFGNYHSSGYDNNRNPGNYDSGYDNSDPNCHPYKRNNIFGNYDYGERGKYCLLQIIYNICYCRNYLYFLYNIL